MIFSCFRDKAGISFLSEARTYSCHFDKKGAGSVTAQATVFPSEPKLTGISPEWWHHFGAKMELGQAVYEAGFAVITGPAATLRIQRVEPTKSWSVEWRVTFGPDSRVSGNIDMTDEELLVAFGLADRPDQYGQQWLLNRFGGDAGEQGKFLRWRNYLNIPGPGTGSDGDPNISIELNDKMKTVVKRLVETWSR